MSIEDEAREYINNKHPAWHDNGVGIVQGSHYRSGFADGAEWQASRKVEAAPAKPVSDTDWEALRQIISNAESQTDDEGAWALPEDVADAILAAGFSRASQPVQVEVTDMADSIRDRHYAVEIEPSDTICGACSMRLPNGKYFGKLVEWPCDAVQLATALGGGPR